MFETTISLGNVLTIISILVSVFGVAWRTMTKINEMNQQNMERINEYHRANSVRLTALETKMEALWEFFSHRMERRADKR